MAEDKSMRLSQVAKILNVGLSTVVSHLSASGFKVESNPNAKIPSEQLEALAKEFKSTELLSGATIRKPISEPPIPESRRREDEDLPRFFRDDTKSIQTAPSPAAETLSSSAAKPEPTPQRVEPISAPIATAPTVDEAASVSVPSEPPVAATSAATKPASQPESIPKQAPAAIGPIATPVNSLETSVSTAPKTKSVADEATPPIATETPSNDPTNDAQEAKKSDQEAPSMPEQPEEASFSPRLPGLTVLGKIELTKKSTTTQPTQRSNESRKRGRAGDRRQDQQSTRSNDDSEPQALQTDLLDNAGDNRPQDSGNIGSTPVQSELPHHPEVPPESEENIETIRARGEQLRGLTVLGTIDLPSDKPKRQSGPVASTDDKDKKRKRKRLRREPVNQQPNTQAAGSTPRTRDGNAPQNAPNTANRTTGQSPTANRTTGQNPTAKNTTTTKGKSGGRNTRDRREEPSEREVRDSIKATQARMIGTKSNRGAQARKDRRRERGERERERLELEQEDAKTLKVTEFVSANDLASLMDVSANEVISVCMGLGMFVSINQRLDAEAITIIADEFGYDIEFVSAEEEIEAGLEEEADDPDTLVPRAPIVTIMGHVDHGKTSLLDYIRRTRVAAGEAGGITQHIGAYSVKTDDGRMITFLDTPGHEAFTAMRARGAKVTDVVIIVIAADDSVMPQTREAINHAQVAGVPIVFAFSKVDKPGANAEKIREELSQMNLLVEEWGGKYQTQEISSKSGQGIPDLLEKVLLEAELLELKANPDRRATGTVIEASLDKGRGYITTILVENGTLRISDVMLVGAHFGRIRAMTDDVGKRIKEAGPSTPVQILGLPGAPQAGDKFNVMETEREAREIANKREQLLREQNLRTRKHITLEEIGRRKAIGSFKELNVIVKGDVDGSVEALSDSLLQLSTEEVQVNIIHKAVGQISESDVLLASASDAIVIGFQVRPSVNARRLAEQEQIEIRLYSIIYDAINEVKDAMTGMLAPTVEEVIIGNIEVRDVFKISKVGTVAGCYVTDGTIKRNNKVRVIRDFIVVYTGEISALKRFKEDVSEVRSSYECGLSLRNFNDIQVGDTIESFELKEMKRTL